MKSFSDKQKLREFSTTKPVIQQMLKGLIFKVKLKSRNTREGKKNLQNQPQIIKKMAIGTSAQYIYINNYFKRKWTKCSNQKTQTG